MSPEEATDLRRDATNVMRARDRAYVLLKRLHRDLANHPDTPTGLLKDLAEATDALTLVRQDLARTVHHLRAHGARET